MECKKIQEALNAYADGQSEPSERSVIESHLESCPACARSLRWVCAMKASTAALPLVQMPQGFKEELLLQVQRRSARPPAEALSFWEALRESPRSFLGYGVASAFAAAVGLLVFNHLFVGYDELLLDDVLAAHSRYEMTMPLADKNALCLDVGLRTAGGMKDDF